MTTPELNKEIHKYSDLDRGPTSQHHTLGSGHNQAAPGYHLHDGRSSPQVANKWILERSVLAVAGGQDHGLQYVPFGESLAVAVNGLLADESVDYTVNWTTGVVTLLDPDLVIGDVVDFRYASFGRPYIAPAISYLAVDDFERADSTNVLNPASDSGIWIIDHDSGVLDAQWGIFSGGARATSLGSNSLGNGSTIERELSLLDMDVTYVLACTSGPYDLSSSLRICIGLTPGHPADKALVMTYAADATVGTVGINDWFGLTPIAAAGSTAVMTAWGGGSTTFRFKYVSSTRTATIWQNGTQIYNAILTTSEAAGLGTRAGVRFRRPYSSFGERLLDFRAVSSV
jgi:hypothetical protein